MTSMLAWDVPGAILLNQQVPNSSEGGYWPHLYDAFVPTTYLRCMVSLHGGKGTKGYQQRVMRVTSLTPATPRTVNWRMLNFWRCMMVFPQGQPCSAGNILVDGVPNPYNPNGVDTVNENNPIGVTTWYNDWHCSGYNDVAYLLDLKAHIQDTFTSAFAVHLHGHSDGGFMTLKMLRLAPNQYGAHLVTSASINVNDPYGWPVTSTRPTWWQFGARDDVLGIYGGIAGAGSHWDDATLRQQPAQLSIGNLEGSGYGEDFVPSLQQSHGITVNFQNAIDQWCDINGAPPETYAEGDGVTTATPAGSTIKTWSYCNNERVLRRVPLVGHKYQDQQAAVGIATLNEMFKWIKLVSG